MYQLWKNLEMYTTVLVGRPAGKRPLEKQRYKYMDDDNKIDLTRAARQVN